MVVFEYPNTCKDSVVVQRINWLFRPYEFLESLRNTYGDFFTLKVVGKEPLIFVGHPQAIQEIFNLPPEHLDVGSANAMLEPLLGSQSLVLLDGQPHQRYRKLLTPPFHGERMVSYGKLIGEITDTVTDNWKINESFDVRPYTKEISLQVILKAIFGLHQGERYVRIKDSISSILNMQGSPLGASSLFFPILQKDWGKWSPWGKYIHRRKELAELLYAEIQERRDNPDPSRLDILSLLMTIRDENGEALTSEELHDNLITMLVAGHETTATALSWALYWISHLPEVKKKLSVELSEVDENASFTELAKLPYLNGVCCETLRIYPIGLVTFFRKLTKPTQIMNYEFPKGVVLSPCIYLIHHREDLYPEPKQFKPERFIERQYSSFNEFIPFGGGHRRCIGSVFSLFEMKIVLAKIMKKFDLALVNHSVVKPMRRGFTVAPSDGKWLVVKGKRESTKVATTASK